MEIPEENIKQYIAGAKSIHEALQLLYNNAPAAQEVDYFRAMMYYLNNNPYCHLIETHKHLVGRPNEIVQCEISDLLLITYSPKRSAMKINFLQAKLAKFGDSKQGLIRSTNGEEFFKFHMNGTQYRLLKDCPIIDPKNTGLPPNILSDACSDSITSYGVFYKKNRNIEMAYEITQLLKPHNISKIAIDSGDRICYFDTIHPKYSTTLRRPVWCWRCDPLWYECPLCCIGHLDLVSSLNSNLFERALLKFQIGSPLCGQLAIEFVNAIISRWNKTGEVADFERFAQESMPLWEEQEQIRRHHLERENRDGEDGYRREIRFDEDANRVPKFILFINVDEEQERREEEDIN